MMGGSASNHFPCTHNPPCRCGIADTLLLVVNTVVYFVVVRPVRRMAQIADQVSVGDTTAPPFPGGGGAEMAALGHSFNRMRISLEKAVRLLES